jgi:pimeloyl-ACP methyl ester carboxylesterase
MGGNVMKRWMIFVCSIILLMTPGLCQANVQEEYDRAYKIYVAAGACMAAYSDRYGDMANRYLEQEGWDIDHYVQAGNSTNARFLLAKKKLDESRQMYVLAIVGTENTKDMQTNLKVDRVFFAGNTLEEFAANAAKDGVASSEPKVHRGFHEYVQAGLTARIKDTNGESRLLTDLLLANPERKIYLVGHSLGGAAATLAGARLISMGVRPEQIEVITFGAPAVGNEAFAAQFTPVLNVTRVVMDGDPVTDALQALVGGYKQFGREIQWKIPVGVNQPHRLSSYIDLAVKNYYDKRQAVLEDGLLLLPRRSAEAEGKERFYVAPLKNSLPQPLAGEFGYMQQVMWDEYRRLLPSYDLSDETAAADLRKKAAAAGCKWLVVPEVSGSRAKQERNVYYITLYQTIYDVATGAVVQSAASSTATVYLTPLEALINSSRNINATPGAWLPVP